jgi:signal transduction histidine kinase
MTGAATAEAPTAEGIPRTAPVAVPEPPIPLVDVFQRVPRAGGLLLAGLGILVLAGWVFGLPILKSLHPGWVAMKPNTALCFVATGTALLLLDARAPLPALGGARRGLALVVSVLGLATLAEYALEIDLGIDQLLFREAPGAVRTSHPGRMAPVTALSFTLASCGLMGLGAGSRRLRRVTDAFALAATLLGCVGVLGYLYRVESFSGLLGYSGFALHTALGLVVLGASVLLTRPEEGILRVLALDTPGSAGARRILAAAIAVPLGLGWLRLEGQSAGLYGTEFGTALFVAAMIVVLSALILRSAWLTEGVEVRRRVAEAELRRSKEETEDLNRELEAFCYSVSHDLRAPLRGVDGFCHALLEDYGDKLDATGAEYLRRARGAAQRMGVLIDDLLDLSRLGRAEIRREEVDVSLLARTVAGGLGQDGRQWRLDWRIQDGLSARADPRLLRVVLENLLGNAFKYTSKNARARIEVGMSEMGGTRVWYVRDDGAGFDMQYAGKLFSPFQRLHSAKEFPGTGIGLATVQRVVHRHGGRIWAESAPGAGAAFMFTLGPEDHP